MKAGHVFSALFFTSLLSLSFRRDNNQVCKKDSLVLETLVARDIRRVLSRVSLLILHTHAESGTYSRDSPRFRRRCPHIMPRTAIGSVPSLPSHAIAYRWCLLPRVHQHRANSPQGSFSKRVLPFQVITMDQFFVRLSFPTPTLGMHRMYQEACCVFLSLKNWYYNRRYFQHAHFIPIV